MPAGPCRPRPDTPRRLKQACDSQSQCLPRSRQRAAKAAHESARDPVARAAEFLKKSSGAKNQSVKERDWMRTVIDCRKWSRKERTINTLCANSSRDKPERKSKTNCLLTGTAVRRRAPTKEEREATAAKFSSEGTDKYPQSYYPVPIM